MEIIYEKENNAIINYQVISNFKICFLTTKYFQPSEKVKKWKIIERWSGIVIFKSEFATESVICF